jgi:GrpB-like predicted nucleotidyltransferase (UPF0157 family)
MRARMADGRSAFSGESDHEPIALAHASTEWPGEFEQLRARLAAALGTGVRIEHVGSTSIPGIAAKPIIDIQVSVPDVTDEARFVPQIESVGVPLRMREPDLGHLYFRNSDPRTVHIHVCEAGSKWERVHLLFRDYLRAHPGAARAYEELKRAAAATYRHDRIAYTESKGPFVDSILSEAEEWAEHNGWRV